MGVPASRRAYRRHTPEDSFVYVKNPGQFRFLRKARHMEQWQLAGACGVKQQTVSQIETGRLKSISDDLAFMFARILDAQWQELFSRESMPGVTSAAHSTDQSEDEDVAS